MTEGGIGLDCPEAIFGIIVSPDHQDGGLDAIQPVRHVPFRPPVVVIRMLHHLFPEGDALAEIRRQRLEIRELPVIAIDIAVNFHERFRPLLGWSLPDAEEGGGKSVHVQHPDAVVVEIIPAPPVRHGGLRRDGLDGRMPGEPRKHRIEPGIGHALDADRPVCAGVRQQPFDRVEGVRRLVGFQPVGAFRFQRTDVLVSPFTEECSADTLKHDDIAVQGKHPHPGPQASGEFFSGRSEAIGGTDHDDRMPQRV